MHRQVGDLKVTESGIAQRGLLVRHLVLPENLAGTDEVIRFIAVLSKNTYLNIMDQYRPAHNADRHPGLRRRITAREYEQAIGLARHMGLTRGKRF
jgi:putative pyruvate formate lyase activating enzyme